MLRFVSAYSKWSLDLEATLGVEAQNLDPNHSTVGSSIILSLCVGFLRSVNSVEMLLGAFV